MHFILSMRFIFSASAGCLAVLRRSLQRVAGPISAAYRSDNTETSQRWRAVGDSVRFDRLGIKPETYRAYNDVFSYFANCPVFLVGCYG